MPIWQDDGAVPVKSESPTVRIRRCEVVLFEPRETVEFQLQSLLSGGNGMVRSLGWMALAPHLDGPVPVSPRQRDLLGVLGPSQWVWADSIGMHDDEQAALVDAGLVLLEQSETDSTAAMHLANDQRLRDSHWHPLAAILHAFTRWAAVDAVTNTVDGGTDTAKGMREVLGPPPANTATRGEVEAIVSPHTEPTEFDALLLRRATCRNFDDSRVLPLPMFTRMLARVFGAQSQVRVGPDLVFHKKNSPSGGGLHPIEAYLVVQNVDGVRPGLYRYRADSHDLVPLPDPERPLRDFIMESVGQQHWFANAHCLVALVPRFDRTFWKYRRHAKGYRVVTLEAGHLSQTLYLSATDLGLGAFITGAINEKHLERGLGLDPIRQGALAVCGFGWRGQHMQTAELDPLEQVWQRVG